MVTGWACPRPTTIRKKAGWRPVELNCAFWTKMRCFNTAKISKGCREDFKNWHLCLQIPPPRDLEAYATWLKRYKRKDKYHAFYHCCNTYHFVAPWAYHVVYLGRFYPRSIGYRRHSNPGKGHSRPKSIVVHDAFCGALINLHRR